MAYTQEELDAAIAKIVRTEIRREYGALGNRKTEQAFSDVQDAAAGVFIAQQNAVFYVVLLAAQRLSEALVSEQATIQEFFETVTATGRRVRPIESLTTLNNATTALRALSTAASTRSSSYQNIEDIPAFQRFESNTQKFLGSAGSNVVSGGDIVQTPSQARENIGPLFNDLEDQHTDVLRRVRLLEGAVEDFTQLNLGSTLSSNIIANARDVLQNSVVVLEAVSAEERLKLIRAVTLDILATRAAVKGFGSLKPPTTFLDIEGTGQVFADATHPATPAFVDSDILGPYPLLSDALELDITLDGEASVTTTIQLQGSFIARAESTVTETYDIGAPNTAGIDNNEFRLELVNYPTVGATTTIDTTLTSGASQLVGDVAFDINGAVTGASPGAGPRIPLIAEAYPQPFRLSDVVDIDITGSVSDATFNAVNPSTDFTALGVQEGDYVLIIDPSSVHDRAYFTVDAGGVSATALVCTQVYPSGAPPPTDETGIQIEVGGDVALRLRITDDRDAASIAPPSPAYVDYRLQALIDRVSILVTRDGPTSEELQFNSTTTVGLFPGAEYVSRQTATIDVANVFNNSFQAAVNGVQRVRADAVFTASIYSGRGRSVPENFTQVAASKFQGTGDLTSTGLDVTVDVQGAATAGVVVGDILGIVASATTADNGLFAAVTAVDDDSVTAAISGATTTTNVDIEIGPDLHTIANIDSTVRVSGNDSINDGDYNLLIDDTLQNTFPFQLTIDAPLPLPGVLPGNLPHIFTLEVGRFFVRFSSLDTTLATAITIDDGGGNPNTAVGSFFSAPPVSAVGTTKYFQIPEVPNALEEEDQLELTTVQYNQPSFTSVVVSIERSALLIELTDELDTDTSSFPFSQTSTVPFARIRKGRLNNYSVFQTSLQGWLELDVNEDSFFTNLSTVLNPLVVNTNPTPAQVNDARLRLQELSDAITQLEGIIESYEADVVTEVDNLVASYQQEGANRAADLLLEAQFSTFFGLDQDEVSYAGNVQKAIKEVARNDLPVRKDNRRGFNEGQDVLLASYEEPDFEYDTSDIDDIDDPDFNIGQDVEFPNRGY